jgi:hypothetical protein
VLAIETPARDAWKCLLLMYYVYCCRESSFAMRESITKHFQQSVFFKWYQSVNYSLSSLYEEMRMYKLLC